MSDSIGLDQENAELLTDELARKYDPERLLRMIARRAGRGERLDHSIRHKYEQRFGVDLGHVRIFSGEFAEEFNRKRNAYAVTVGATGMILMGGSPEKSMASASGQALLAHELTHVAQAQRGLHRKATFDGGMPFTEEHEEEAEAVEDEEGSSAGAQGAAQAAAAAEEQKELLEKAIEAITQRVQDLAAEAARNHVHRNGSQRRA
ncbi:MAG TPA: DUF4157 domain-containing protein [Kofleriaceae bacterium]|nr:DUF4157 domain-containing protein [Kofleriaceae bacterium]